MDPTNVIMGKKVLIVDDEKDILEVLTELLSVCKIDTALSFEDAKSCLKRMIIILRFWTSWGLMDTNSSKSQINVGFLR